MDEAARTAIAKHNAVEWYTERAMMFDLRRRRRSVVPAGRSFVRFDHRKVARMLRFAAGSEQIPNVLHDDAT